MKKQWTEIKNYTLGKKFDLSVVFADDRLMKKLNSKYRKRKKTTNVLSFPLSDSEGEIFVNRELVIKEAKKRGLFIGGYTDYVFIHSLLHLKGYVHGKKMEAEEERILDKFKIRI